MVEWGVLSDRNIGLTVYTSFATGAAMFAVGFFPDGGVGTVAGATNIGFDTDILLLQYILCLRGGKQRKPPYQDTPGNTNSQIAGRRPVGRRNRTPVLHARRSRYAIALPPPNI